MGVKELRRGRFPEAFEKLDRLVHHKDFHGKEGNIPPEVLWWHGLTTPARSP